MKGTSGSWSASLASRRFPTSAQSLGVEIARLIFFGAMAVMIHAATRGRFELAPGHQGVAWIALLIYGRLTSGLRWTGTTTALGAGGASFIPLWRLGDPLVWVGYLAAGITVDLLHKTLPGGRAWVWLLVVLGGVAHATKPVLRFLSVGFTGWHYDSLLMGLPYPVATHFFFGAMGAILAVGLMKVRSRVNE